VRYKLGVIVGLVIGLAAVSFGASPVAANDVPATGSVTSTELVVTGIVTGRDGNIVTMAADDGKTYKVDARDASVMLDRLPGTCMSLRVGDMMRVYGTLSEPNQIKASRVHIFLSETEAAATGMPVTGAGPTVVEELDDVELPSVGQGLGSWRSRGLVTNVRYSDRTMLVITSKGMFTIDMSAATLVDGNRTVTLAKVSQGDAVRIWGELTGLNKIRADRVDIIRHRSQQEAAVPMVAASIRGRVVSVDYPSFTFKIVADTGEYSILVDEGTRIQFQRERKAFQDVRIGQVVKVTGFGGITSGIAASEVLIVGTPR